MTPEIIVYGDAIADYHLHSEVSRISPEAPVPILATGEDESLSPGGALNVASNAVALGARASIVAVVGDDDAGRSVRQTLEQCKIDTSGLVTSPDVTTITKTRFLSRGQQLMRVDRENGADHYGAASRAVERSLERVLGDHPKRLVLVSDYAKGTVTRNGLSQIHSTRGRRALVDPAGKLVERYAGLWGLKANRNEAEALLGRDLRCEGDQLQAVRDLLEAGFESVWITLGAAGSVFALAGGEVRHLQSRARSVFDITGAGDTFLAALGVGLASGRDATSATTLANAASGLAVERLGTAVISRQELMSSLRRTTTEPDDEWQSRLLDPRQGAAQAERFRELGMRVGFTNGCFDLLHPGHLDSLDYARRHVDVLFVGLNVDDTVRRTKGSSRPIMPCRDRSRMLLGLRCVDYVIPFEEETPEELVRQLRPDVLFKGEDWAHFVAGGDFVEGYGGEVHLIPVSPNHSTTRLIESLRTAAAK